MLSSLYLFLEALRSWGSFILNHIPEGLSLGPNPTSTKCLAPWLAELDLNGGYYFRVMWRDWEESRQMVRALLEGRAHQHLVDFDCHLDDIRQDWTNQQLNARITQWVGSTNGNA